MRFPRLYAIADADLLKARGWKLESFASELRDAGVALLQYRNKNGGDRTVLDDAATLIDLRAEGNFKLIMNDRADLALLSGCDGVHLGQEDLGAEDARRILGPAAWIGVSTHSPAQVVEANETSCDYIAYGPIFSTASKNNPDPTVGLDGLRLGRGRTRKPLVAIGGITRENCREVIEAGADSVAVISGLLSTGQYQTSRQIAEQFLALLDS